MTCSCATSHIQCWDCSWGSSFMTSHYILPGKSNIDKGEGVISKVMLPSQHFCPRLSENNNIVNSFWRITQNIWQIHSWYSPELRFGRLSLLLLLLGTILRLWNMVYPHMCFCEEGFCMTQYCVTAVSYAPVQQ